jgi:hypothetical protein
MVGKVITKKKRRMDSAAAGGTFLSRNDLMARWGCTYRTVITRVKEGNIPEFVFSDTSVRYKVSDVEAYENKALASGFLKRAEQLKREEETGGRAKTSFAAG